MFRIRDWIVLVIMSLIALDSIIKILNSNTSSDRITILFLSLGYALTMIRVMWGNDESRN